MDSPSQIARRRLFPSLTDPSYLTLRSRRQIFSSWALRCEGRNLTALDIGGRYQPYRPLLNNVSRYFSMDLVASDALSVVASADENLPFADSSFDVVIATQVFEYLRNPCETAKRIHDVLKPGGVLLASFAGCAPRFVDAEHWRFTPSGLRLILAPFENVKIVPELRSTGSLVRLVNQGLDVFVRYRSLRYLYRITVCPLLNLFGLALEMLRLTSNDQFTSNFSVRAVKQG